jgi:NADH-quinone oxidoreductase subunit G
MATIYVEGKPYTVEEEWNLLRTCLSLGFDIPYFCWHPALGSVGACRQCAVKVFKDEHDTKGEIVMACMTPVKDGTRISIDDPEVREFRASVIEWLMVNHPHDCPVCDEGGECHLQDMTVLTGHTHREFRFEKRTHRNQDLGPFVNHEMNRCIACYRCVRFYREHAGGRDLDVLGAHDHVYFGRHEDGVLESEFSGNLVEICPTGVFTDKTLKQHYGRKWDLQTAPSICVHCGLGCNTIPGERYGQLRRIRNRYHGEVNRYFLCDRGRYGYEFVNSERRIRRPLLHDGSGELRPVAREAALQQAVSLLTGGKRAIGIGSPRASLEANFALRQLVGAEHFYLGFSESDCRLVSTALKIMQRGPARIPSLHDVEQSDTVLVLGEDVTNTAPMLALTLRQSARQIPMHVAEKLLHIHEWQDAAVQEAIQLQEGPLAIATSGSTKLDEVATKTIRLAPDDLARFGFAVAHAIDAQAPPVTDLADELRILAEESARLLTEGKRPLVVSGSGCGSEAVMQAAANIAQAAHRVVCTAELCLVVPECNSMGLALMGGNSLEAAFEVARDGAVDTVVILENDLYRRADVGKVDAFLDAARHVIAIDHLGSATTAKSELVLPAGTFAETEGTLVNNESRAQRFYQVFVPAGEVQASWRWLRDVMVAAGRSDAADWQIVDDVMAALARQMPAFEAIPEIASLAGFRIVGQKIPRQPHRYTGRTAMHADADVNEPQPPPDPDSPLAFSMEGYEGQPPAPLITRYWTPHWNSVQALNKFQEEVAGPLRGGDPGRRLVESGQAVDTAYFDEVPAAFEPRVDQWLVVPVYHIFGSEELSVLTPSVAGLSPHPYLALSPGDATRIGVSEGDEVRLEVDGASLRLPARLMADLAPGVVGLPVGLQGLPEVSLPRWARVSIQGERQAGPSQQR